MSDNDLIRRGDALAAITLGATVTKLQAAIVALPAVQPQPVAVNAIRLNIERRIGMYGSAYDGPTDARAYTYKHQPSNLPASLIGEATMAAAPGKAGDCIDRGLLLLKELEARGFGVFTLVDGEESALDVQPITPQQTAQVPEVQALVEAVDYLLNNYLLDEYDEPELCVNDDHWSAIHDAFAALRTIREGEA